MWQADLIAVDMVPGRARLRAMTSGQDKNHRTHEHGIPAQKLQQPSAPFSRWKSYFLPAGFRPPLRLQGHA